MRWKWIFGILIASVLLVVLGIYLTISLYDFNNLKPKIAHEVQEATGRKLTLAGDVEVELGLTPALTIQEVSFQNASWGSRPSMATIDCLALEVELLPLLRGSVAIKQLVLISPDILIEKSKSGRINLVLEGMKKKKSEEVVAPEKTDDSAEQSSPLAFDHVRIEQGNVQYVDHTSQQTYQLALREATVARTSPETLSLSISGKYNKRPLELKATMGDLFTLLDGKTSWPVDLRLSLAETSLAGEGTVLDVVNGKGIDLSVTAQGGSVPELLEAFGISDVPEMGPFTVSGRLTDSRGPLAAEAIELEVGREDLARVEATGHIGNIRSFRDIAFSAAGKGESVKAVFQVFHVSEVPDIGPFQIAGDVRTEKDVWSISNLTLNAGTKDRVVVQLAGNMRDVTTLQGADLDFSVAGEDLRHLQPLWKQPVPMEGPFEVSGHLFCPSERKYEVSQMKASVAESRLEGQVTVNLEGDTPEIFSSLQAEVLNLTPFFDRPRDDTSEPAKEDMKAADRTDKVFSSNPLPFDMLDRANTDLTIAAGEVRLPFLTITDLSSRIELAQGNLFVRPLQFTMAEGNFDGSFTIGQTGEIPVVEAAFQLDGSNLGRVLDQFGAAEFLNGIFDVDVDVRGNGTSMAQLMAGLHGKSAVVMKDGKMDERLLGFIGGDLTLGLLELVNPFKKERNYTRIHCLICGVIFDEGLAESSALLLDTDKVTVVGHGKADLKQETLDVSFKPSPKKGIGIKGLGQLNLSLGQLTKPFKLTGTFTDLSFSFDPTETFLTLGKAVGGAALFGPVGLAAALAGGQLGDKDPCRAAMEAIETEAAP